MKLKTLKDKETNLTCYDCKFIECIPYTPMDYCIEKGRWIRRPDKICRKFKEADFNKIERRYS